MVFIFEDIRVIEIAGGVAGPLAGLLLAENGAEVVKVEPPGGDPSRDGPAFHVYNRSKRSVIADLSAPGGRQRVHDLVATADAVIVDLTPTEARRLGLDYQSLAALRPDLVYVGMPPFGDRGPLADVGGDEAMVAAYGGIVGEQDAYDGPPAFVTVPVASTAAGILAAGALALGLMHRRRSGAGQEIVVSLLAGALAVQTDGLACIDGEPFGDTWGKGYPLGNFPLFRVYRCSDDYLAIAVGNVSFWQRFAAIMNKEEWLQDPRFQNAPWDIPSTEDRDWLAAQLTPIFVGRPRSEWLGLLQKADIPCAPVLSREEFMGHEQVLSNGMRVEVEDPVLGRTAQLGAPLRFERTPGAVRSPAPRAGEHDALEPRPAAALPVAAPRPLPRFALEGVRVIDLAGYIAGTYCPTLLADLGADVIKVETASGDPFRDLGPAFAGYNRSKRAIVLDLKQPEGKEILYRLVRGADVVVENYRPGTAARLGVDYDTLSRINPRLVYASVYGYGSSGPLAKEPAFDSLLQALTGVMKAQGGADEPVYLTASICDYGAALLATFGVLAALYERERSGRGQRLEGSLLNAGMFMQAGDFVFFEGKPAGMQGGRDLKGLSPLHRCYRAADGWFLLDARSASAYEALCRLLPATEDAREPLDTVTRRRAEEHPADRLEAVFAARPRSDWLQLLCEAGVPAMQINRWRDLLHDEQVLANGLMDCREHPELGQVCQPAPPIRFSRTPSVVQRRAPLLGEHTREVLRELGYGEARIENLIARGVVGEAVAAG